jgi:hypothetical protein
MGLLSIGRLLIRFLFLSSCRLIFIPGFPQQPARLSPKLLHPVQCEPTDIPLGRGYCGKYILLLRLCFADPVKRRVYVALGLFPRSTVA